MLWTSSDFSYILLTFRFTATTSRAIECIVSLICSITIPVIILETRGTLSTDLKILPPLLHQLLGDQLTNWRKIYAFLLGFYFRQIGAKPTEKHSTGIYNHASWIDLLIYIYNCSSTILSIITYLNFTQGAYDDLRAEYYGFGVSSTNGPNIGKCESTILQVV